MTRSIITRLVNAAGSRILSRHEAKVQALAAKNPIWAQIQQRRINPDDPGHLIMLSDDLSFVEYQIQEDIENAVKKDPFYLGLATAMLNFSPRLRRSITDAYLRSRGKITQEDASCLSSVLCSRLALQLDGLANSLTGWPGVNSNWPTSDAWSKDLRFRASQLRRFDGSDEQTNAIDAWYDLATKAGMQEEEELASDLHTKISVDNIDAAKAALHWVADNLDLLWD